MSLFCWFHHFLDSRAEICQIFRWYFGPNDDTLKLTDLYLLPQVKTLDNLHNTYHLFTGPSRDFLLTTFLPTFSCPRNYEWTLITCATYSNYIDMELTSESLCQSNPASYFYYIHIWHLSIYTMLALKMSPKIVCAKRFKWNARLKRLWNNFTT